MSTFKTWEEMTEQEQLQSIVWDAYKDAHGIRPRHLPLNSMTVEQLRAELTGLEEIISNNIVAQEREQEEAIVRFEELVRHTIEKGARTRENALRWLAEAEQYNGDWDYVCYNYGLPYGYFKRVAY